MNTEPSREEYCHEQPSHEMNNDISDFVSLGIMHQTQSKDDFLVDALKWTGILSFVEFK